MAYEVFVNALHSCYLKQSLVIPDLEDHNPAGNCVYIYTVSCVYIYIYMLLPIFNSIKPYSHTHFSPIMGKGTFMHLVHLSHSNFHSVRTVTVYMHADFMVSEKLKLCT